MDNGGDVAGGGGKTLHFSKKDSSIICVVRVSSRAKPPLLECSLQLLSVAQLSQKTHGDCNHTIVIAVTYTAT